jgi:hypothetical protein
LECYYQRHYININCEKFDRWLVSLIALQVEGHWGTIFKVARVEDDYSKITPQQTGKNMWQNILLKKLKVPFMYHPTPIIRGPLRGQSKF